MNNRVSLIGYLLLVFTGINLLAASFLVIMNQSIHGYIFIFSFFVSLIFLFFATEREQRFSRKTVVNLVIFIIIIGGAIKISEKFYDFSYDGQAYHQEALIHMKDNWNPLYEQLTTGTAQDLWINHYAKGIWYLGTIIYELTGNIESAKAFNFVLLISTFLILVGYLQTKLNNVGLVIVVSSLMVLSPVVTNQIFTNYNDFFIVLLIINLIVGYLNYYETPNYKILINIFISIILLVNIKFTALGYALILTGIPILLYIYNFYIAKASRKEKKQKILLLAFTICSSFIVAIAFVGSSSYIKNTITKGHPFYPLAGEGKVDIITVNSPAGLSDLNRIEKMYVSIFSETYNGLEEEPKTKFPLSVSKEEIFYSKATDTRIGGFGPLFGLIVILTLCLSLIYYRKIDKEQGYVFLILVAVIMISIMINPEPWWARYVPQLWIIPLLFVLLIVINKIKSYVAYAILLVYMLNILIIGYATMGDLYNSQMAMEDQLESLKAYSNEAIPIEFGVYEANRARLEEYGINFKKVDSIEGCQNIIQLTYSTARACLDNQQN
ncbi:hypothetical protein RKS58_03295 [Lysinibacillus capsici]|uniref:hypothetical protein n=1 Tax=Lysinibacillus capsici TaxID=2115968 RepID=UPI0028BEB649|nr:hypothetical protein [Lysinibacillus capsici]WNN76876.1 hypothetical protein RKS58_03295 [Lysinibacillus capsici]